MSAKTVRNNIEKIHGLRFMVEHLDLHSGLAKRLLLSLPLITDKAALAKEISNTTEVFNCLKNPILTGAMSNVCVKLDQLHDIQGTLKRIAAGETLDDVELFEVKRLAMLCQEIAILMDPLALSFFKLPSLQEVVDLLDPEKQRVPHFYIYSSYSGELAMLREKAKQLHTTQPEESEKVRLMAVEIEDGIRQKLSQQLSPFVEALENSLHSVAYLDLAIAKAKQAIALNLVKPEISEENTRYTGLFNPQIKTLLEAQDKMFQPIDIELLQAPCLITGVNMGGKTVLLKTIALSQYLFQYGFYVPAAKAVIAIADQVVTSMGDDQSELSGLSSFASEMMNINEIVRLSRSKTRSLVLIDELARTTNPEEGKAIVNATLDLLSKNGVRSLITTHYSGLSWNGRKLSVKGLSTEKMTEPLTLQNINNYMDYSLVENDSQTSTHRALQIAQLLGVDQELLDKAGHYLENN